MTDAQAAFQSRVATLALAAAVTDAVRGVLPAERQARRRAAAQAYGEYLRRLSAQQIQDDVALIESSNDIALRDSQW